MRTQCLEKKEYGAAILPCGAFELGAQIRGHPLVASDIRAFDTVLSSMKHHQVLCLACMLSVCLVCTCCIRHILVRTPSKPVVRSSLVKNGLKIVNKNIVMNGLLVSCSPMFPNKSGWFRTGLGSRVSNRDTNVPLDLTSWGNRTPVTDWFCQMPSVF